MSISHYDNTLIRGIFLYPNNSTEKNFENIQVMSKPKNGGLAHSYFVSLYEPKVILGDINSDITEDEFKDLYNYMKIHWSDIISELKQEYIDQEIDKDLSINDSFPDTPPRYDTIHGYPLKETIKVVNIYIQNM